MNWGTKLIIAMGLFMGFIIVLSTRMILSDKDDLVETDYYEKGLNYDKDYDRQKNVLRDKAEPAIEAGQDSIVISFTRPATGTARLLHSKDRSMDRVVVLNTLGNDAAIPVAGMQAGQWQLVLEWKSGEDMYLFKKGVFIP